VRNDNNSFLCSNGSSSSSTNQGRPTADPCQQQQQQQQQLLQFPPSLMGDQLSSAAVPVALVVLQLPVLQIKSSSQRCQHCDNYSSQPQVCGPSEDGMGDTRLDSLAAAAACATGFGLCCFVCGMYTLHLRYLIAIVFLPCFLCCSYVFCRQRQDDSLRRGGEQAAVVVLAVAPLSAVLLPLSQAAGHWFFCEGPPALQQVLLLLQLLWRHEQYVTEPRTMT